ncbi:MAG: hypothetical protein ACRECO_16765 [Xanthobacteraceae bacterium]
MSRPSEGQVIPFRHARNVLSPRAAVATAEAGGSRARTLRPIDVLLLLPIIAPLVAAILLGLLGWFVAWLAVVAALVMVIVFADLVRAVQWRLYGDTPLGPHAIGGR